MLREVVTYFQAGDSSRPLISLSGPAASLWASGLSDGLFLGAFTLAALAGWQVLRRHPDLRWSSMMLFLVGLSGAAAVAHLIALVVPKPGHFVVPGSLKLACAAIAAAAAVLIWRRRSELVSLAGQADRAGPETALQDETRRRVAAEDALRLARSELADLDRAVEARVARRTAELTAANDELQRCADIACHDLRAPLRALITIPEWLRESLVETHGEVADVLEADLAEMERQGKRLDTLLSDLLTYLRIGQGDARGVFDPTEAIEESVELSGIPDGFTVEIVPPFPRVRGVPTEFRLVMQKLIENAIRHHDRDHGRITILARQSATMSVIAVCDDGPGIDRRFAAKVFDMFSTLRPRDELEGSGLGLAMVKKSMERAGGRVGLGSPAHGERGARIELFFPKVTAAECKEGATECSRSCSRRTAISLSAT